MSPVTSPPVRLQPAATPGQSFTRAREQRLDAPADLLDLGDQAARYIAAQFPWSRDTAGRAVMAAAMLIAGFARSYADDLDEETADYLDEVTCWLSLAAEQVVREAGAR